MNKRALKEFAVYARNELRRQIELRARTFGITSEGFPELTIGTDYVELNGEKYDKSEQKAFEKLLSEFENKGYDQLIEEVAYTWFNRFIALRYMEIHGYLPSRIRVLSSEIKGKVDPDLLTDYKYSNLKVDDEIITSLLQSGKRDEAYRKLIVSQCNELNSIMPFLFEKISDYTELMLPGNLLHVDSVVNRLVYDLEENSFKHVEVIGWLYQYYISEKKDEVFAGLKQNKKITKENIPAATQLFTPHWIVRYMIENTLGYLWMNSNEKSELKKHLPYYLESSKQDSSVDESIEKLNEIILSPEDITIMDPACGSGHILVYAFDVLYEIYEEQGYQKKEIPKLILEKNLYGIDIDDRAVQLASFALLMKARKKTRNVFSNPPVLNVISIKESNNIDKEAIAKLLANGDKELKGKISNIFDDFTNAKNYGSILNAENMNYQNIEFRINDLENKGAGSIFEVELVEDLFFVRKLIQQAKLLSKKYNIVVTNPPYMGSKGMNKELNDFARENYKNTKSDLSTIFMERGLSFLKEGGLISLINIPTWMFISSYQNFRKELIENTTIKNLLHLGRGIFGSDFGTVAFVLQNGIIKNYKGTFKKFFTKHSLVDSIETKERKFFDIDNIYSINQNEFLKIPSHPIAYWVSEDIRRVFLESPKLGEKAEAKQGLATANNNLYLRLWHEVSFSKVGLNFISSIDAEKTQKKWIPFNKGGSYKRWYGNQEYVINWENNGGDIKAFRNSVIRNESYYFKKGISWTDLTSGGFSARYVGNGFIFDTSGPTMFTENNNINYLLAYVNSKPFQEFLNLTMTGLHYNNGMFKYLPFRYVFNEMVENKTEENILISKNDWDLAETSWDFKKHPFIVYGDDYLKLNDIFSNWESNQAHQFKKLQQNEEQLNSFFINLYGLNNELTPVVLDKEVSIKLANREKDTKSFLSYFIGLVMGRYSLDVEGVCFAGGEWCESQYSSIIPDEDGIIPITSNPYFEDDVVVKLDGFLEKVYGKENLQENLYWLADSLTMKSNETPTERLRRYFFDEFYKDHCKTYQKRPIYWMAESGKKKGFRALFYLHRYTPETLATMRFNYVQNLQEKLRQEENRLETALTNPDLSTTERRRMDKQLSTIRGQQEELVEFDKVLAEYANQRIELVLDDGVVENYKKLGDVLAKIK